MKTYKVTIEISVAECWIADGFDLTSDTWKEIIEEEMVNLLPYANWWEINAKVTKVIPPKFTIGELEELGLI